MSKPQKHRNQKEQKEKKPFPVLRLLVLITLTLFFFVLYQVLLRIFFFAPIMYIYTVLGAGLFIAYYAVNAGFSRRLPKRSALPREWSRERTEAFLVSMEKRKRAARVILLFLVPVLLTLFADAMIYLLYEHEGAVFYPSKAGLAQAVEVLL